jgi:cytochrome c2
MAATHLATEEHHPGAGGYARVAIVLFAFTMIEVAVYYIEPIRLLDLLAPILLFLSLLKFCGIGGWYMHLKMDSKIFFVFFAAGVTLAGTIILALMTLFGELLDSGKPIESISTKPLVAAMQTPGTMEYANQLGGSPIGNVELGREFWMLKGCSGCHIAPGIPGGGQIGPNQSHFSQRPTIAGGLLANTPANVEKWLKDPPAVKPGTLMPNLSLTDDQIKDLTAFLYSLP